MTALSALSFVVRAASASSPRLVAIRLGALALALVLAVPACNLSFVTHIGAVSPQPYVRPMRDPVQEPLTVVISARIPDALRLEPPQMQPVEIVQFRTSLEAGVRNAFAGMFREVQFASAPPAEGYVLEIHRFEPKGFKAGEVEMGGGTQTTTVERDETKIGPVTLDSSETKTTESEPVRAYELQFSIDCDAVLSLNGEPLVELTERFVGEDKSWKKTDAPRLLRATMELPLSALAREASERLAALPAADETPSSPEGQEGEAVEPDQAGPEGGDAAEATGDG